MITLRWQCALSYSCTALVHTLIDYADTNSDWTLHDNYTLITVTGASFFLHLLFGSAGEDLAACTDGHVENVPAGVEQIMPTSAAALVVLGVGACLVGTGVSGGGGPAPAPDHRQI